MFLSLTRGKRELSGLVYSYQGYMPGKLVLSACFCTKSVTTISSPLRLSSKIFLGGILNTDGYVLLKTLLIGGVMRKTFGSL